MHEAQGRLHWTKVQFFYKVPEQLICQGCTKMDDKKDWVPLNIVYCIKGECKEIRAALQDLKKA